MKDNLRQLSLEEVNHQVSVMAFKFKSRLKPFIVFKAELCYNTRRNTHILLLSVTSVAH